MYLTYSDTFGFDSFCPSDQMSILKGFVATWKRIDQNNREVLIFEFESFDKTGAQLRKNIGSSDYIIDKVQTEKLQAKENAPRGFNLAFQTLEM